MVVLLDTKRTSFLNASFDNLNWTDVLDIVDECLETGNSGYMVSLNVDACVLIDKDPAFKSAFIAAKLALMDSQPLMNIASHNGIAVRQKLSGSDLMPLICEHAAKKGYSCFFLGGKPGVPEAAALNMASEYPGLKVAGTLSPDFGFEKNTDKLADVIAYVSVVNPDILFMCLGMPKSEMLLYKYIEDLGAGFAFSVGAAIDFAAGNSKRAPKWMQDAGLEWLYRFLQEPKRLYRRYFIESWAMAKILFEARAKSGLRKKSSVQTGEELV